MNVKVKEIELNSTGQIIFQVGGWPVTGPSAAAKYQEGLVSSNLEIPSNLPAQ